VVDDANIRALVIEGRCEAAVKLLYEAYAHDVERFARCRVVGHDSAMEVCQEIWAAVTASLPRCRFEAPLKIWVLSIARHKSFDAGRRRAGHDTLDSEIATGGPLGALLGLRTATTPSRALSRRRRSDTVLRALATLDEEDCELLLLRYVNDLRPAEIAALLPGSVSANAISQRIVRAARRVRRHLEAEGSLG
jgi:RNA polymerase sigma factor (sigma-70 family)